jgi:hypothetical protein
MTAPRLVVHAEIETAAELFATVNLWTKTAPPLELEKWFTYLVGMAQGLITESTPTPAEPEKKEQEHG